MIEELPHVGLWVRPTEINATKKYLREKVAKLDYRDVRRERVSVYEAILKELLEDGCTLAAEHFKRLAAIEKSLMDTREIEKTVLESSGLMVAIVDNIQFAEKTCRLKNDPLSGIKTIFQTTFLIESKGPDYNWLTKELYLIMDILALKWRDVPGLGEIDCRAKYYFGKFLIRRVELYTEAIVHLEKALFLSRGKSWTTANESKNILHDKASFYLANAYLYEAERVFKKNPVSAERLAYNAALTLAEGNPDNKFLYCKVNLRRCEYLIRCKLFKDTLVIHAKIQPMIYSMPHPEFKCEMFLQQGICYFHLLNNEQSLRKLKQSIRLGEIYELNYFKAHALVQMGKVYATEHKTFNLAQVTLKNAKVVFENLKDSKNITRVDYFGAVLKAQEILPGLLTIIKATEKNFCALITLHEWKDQSIPFWVEDFNHIAQLPPDKDYKNNIITPPYKCVLDSMLK